MIILMCQGVGSQLTKEEQLLLERKRVRAYGITAYDYEAPSRTFAFCCGSSVLTVTDSDDRTGMLGTFGRLSDMILLGMDAFLESLSSQFFLSSVISYLPSCSQHIHQG